MTSSAVIRRRRRVLGLVLALLVMISAVLVGVRLGRGGSPAPLAGCVARTTGQFATLDTDQAVNASLVATIGLARGLPHRAVIVALATALQESKLRNLDYGDADSLGLFQQRPSQGWGTPAQVQDPVYATNAFYDALVKVTGWESLPVTEAAQEVQRSGFPSAYADNEPEAELLAAATTGTTAAGLACTRASRGAGAPASLPTGLAAAWTGRAPAVTPVVTAAAGTVVLRVRRGSSGNATSAVWAVASWVVARADLYGVGAVTVGRRSWTTTAGSTAWKVAPTLPAASAGLLVTVVADG